jgi:hypothetical protein
MTSLNDEEIAKSFLKAYQYLNSFYSGKDRLESLTFNKLILQDNKATMQFIKNIKISNDCLLEKENQIKNPPYKIKE